MRSAIIAAAFAASVIAVPLEKRAVDVEVVTDVATNVVYVTQYTTVTGAQQTAAASPEPQPSPEKQWGGSHWGHNHWWGGHKGHKAKTTTTQVATWAPPPAPTTKTTPVASWEPAPTHTKTQATQPASSPSSAPASGSYSDVAKYQHNIHRSNHSASDLEWDQGLANVAKKIADTCVYGHSMGVDGVAYGQNIAAGVDGSGIDRIITDMFYDGEVNYFNGLYGQPNPQETSGTFEQWGHFSQIVWKNTKTFGCYTTHCTNGLADVGSDVPPYFTVCNYGPPGNVANEYGDNIGRPLGHPSVVI